MNKHDTMYQEIKKHGKQLNRYLKRNRMFCYKCKKENLELKDINRLIRESGEEVVICDTCMQEGNLGETLAWSSNNSPY
jgi:hypothetical protein